MGEGEIFLNNSLFSRGRDVLSLDYLLKRYLDTHRFTDRGILAVKDRSHYACGLDRKANV